MSVIFELGKYVVPYFHVTITVTTYGTSWTAASVFFSTVIVDFGTRAARACAVLPEVIFFTKLEDAFRCNADLISPDSKGFIIFLVNGWIQTIWVESDNFSQEFPGPCDSLVFKIISKGEITEHLKKCTVTGGLSDIFDITGTNTFLTGGHSSSWRNLLSGKIRFQWCHTCID